MEERERGKKNLYGKETRVELNGHMPIFTFEGLIDNEYTEFSRGIFLYEAAEGKYLHTPTIDIWFRTQI